MNDETTFQTMAGRVLFDLLIKQNNDGWYTEDNSTEHFIRIRHYQKNLSITLIQDKLTQLTFAYDLTNARIEGRAFVSNLDEESVRKVVQTARVDLIKQINNQIDDLTHIKNVALMSF